MANRQLDKLLKQKMSRREFLAFSGVAALSLFGVLRVISELKSHAAGTPNAFEPESGTVAGGASIVTASGASGGSALKFGAAAAGPALPDVPTVKYTDLYHTGDTLSQTLNRVNSSTGYKAVILPDGLDVQISGFPDAGNTYGVYAPYVIGLIGPGINNCRISLKPMSSTAEQQARITSTDNPLTVMRLMSNNPGTDTGYPSVNSGWHLAGTDQAVSVACQNRPHNYSGITNYGGLHSVYQDFKVSGMPGSGNYPPFETFVINSYRDSFTTYRRVEVDGYNIQGNLVGGSALGGNFTQDIYLEDCYLHDGFVSSLTFSQTGIDTSTAATQSHNIHTLRTKVWNNANHDRSGTHRFAGVNHEGCYGTILHDQPDIHLAGFTDLWDTQHMSFANATIDCPTITINEPTWYPSEAWPGFKGAFIITVSSNYQMGNYNGPNKQTTTPKVIKNGVNLQPVYIPSYPGDSGINIDPTKQFVVIR